MKGFGYIGAFALISGVVLGCKSNEPGTPTPVQDVRARIVESRQEHAPVTLTATGALHARQTAVLSAQVMGRVQQVVVREGDSVREGQTLVILDDAMLK